MIICPNCNHENIDGSVYCDECGAQLMGTDALVTHNIEDSITKEFESVKTDVLPAQLDDVDAWASLHLINSGQIMPLTTRPEYTLGRISEGQPIMPDIDLTPYQAYAMGVSRLHAVIKQQGEHVTIMDLGSSNGTYLNGARLKTNVEEMLHHGDLLSLGKLKIQVLIKSKH